MASRAPENNHIQGMRIRDAIHDRGDKIEHALRYINLLLFGVVALAFISQLLVQGLTAWLLVPLTVMAAAFIAGLRSRILPIPTRMNSPMHYITENWLEQRSAAHLNYV